MGNALVQLDKILGQLETITDVDAGLDLRDRLRAIEHYHQGQRASKEIELEAVRLRLRLERRLGQLLAKSVKPGNPQLSNGKTIGLNGMGISRSQSSHWQLVASLPSRTFEKALAAPNVSTKMLVGLSHTHRRQRAANNGPTAGHGVITGDMSKLFSRLENDSVDLFLSDPPFADLSAYEQLAKLASAKLKKGKLVVCYGGVQRLPELLNLMSKHLKYHWVISVRNTGPNRAIWSARIQNSWRPLLLFSKGVPDHGMIVDSLEGGGRTKGDHDWQQAQSESELLISKLTAKSALVVDPYVGSGTVGIACRKLGRAFIGTELEPSTAKLARKRLQETTVEKQRKTAKQVQEA